MSIIKDEGGLMPMNERMSENAIRCRKEYLKQWRANNPDKVKAAQMRYWNKKANEQRNEQENKNQNNGGVKIEKR